MKKKCKMSFTINAKWARLWAMGTNKLGPKKSPFSSFWCPYWLQVFKKGTTANNEGNLN